ncbi:hypothetical protein GRF29_185g88916 [Pseudopithomyces chartarum]|uniref:Rhodopsin domain-containing protein n=1 Tax=Pseudopithomyces chartarum TaxID=1892770 RepID=A0AAN6LQH4_9PLEO|nr:hypothetical protein GRF29_185g88916 [Pseudopithomyces chartarum]
MCISTQPQFATGYHIWDLPLDIFIKSGATGSIAMANQLLFILITAFTKISILLTYLRLFPSKPNRYFCHTMLAFTTIWALTLFPTTLFQCHPIQAYWLPFQYPTAKCLSVLTLFWTAGTLNLISDFLIFLWPATQLAKVQVALKERVTLIVMFSLGLVICGAGVLRLWYTPVFAGTYDVLWHGADFYVIVSVETSVGIRLHTGLTYATVPLGLDFEADITIGLDLEIGCELTQTTTSTPASALELDIDAYEDSSIDLDFETCYKVEMSYNLDTYSSFNSSP